jgi:hypothetical protein
MASGANAFPSKGGFNQSGGAHFIILSALDSGNAYINKLATAGSNSGGAFVNPTFSLVAPTDPAIGLGSGDVALGKLLKDMGRSVVSAGRTFRKFQSVGTGNAARFGSSFGVNGSATTAPNPGYGSFYLEVAREGNPGSTTALPAPIARYF